MKINNNFYIMVAVFVLIPIVMPYIIDDPIINMGVNIGCILGFIWYIKTRSKNLAQSLLSSKMTWVCSACGKEGKEATCSRCGSKQRKLR